MMCDAIKTAYVSHFFTVSEPNLPVANQTFPLIFSFGEPKVPFSEPNLPFSEPNLPFSEPNLPFEYEMHICVVLHDYTCANCMDLRGFMPKIKIHLANQTFLLANQTFLLANQTFLLANQTFPLANQTFPLANQTFLLALKNGLILRVCGMS